MTLSSWASTLAAALAAMLATACGEKADPAMSPAGSAARPMPEASFERADADLVIVVRDVVQLPATAAKPPLARINTLVHAGDGSPRLFAVDMDGVIHVIERDQLLAAPFLDMTKARGTAFVHDDTEKGLATVAFHPDFARTGAPGFGRLYTASTERAESALPDFASPDPGGEVSHHDVITEWRVDAQDANRVDPASRREVLRIAHPLRDHTIGQVAFNPNAAPGSADHGMLYIGVGDGGDTFPERREVDAMRNAQNTRVPLGKMLRINPLPGDGRKYTVPPDNPFVETRSSSGKYGPTACAIRSGSLGLRWNRQDVHRRHRAGAGGGGQRRPGRTQLRLERARRSPRRQSSRPGQALRVCRQTTPRTDYTYPAVQYRHDIWAGRSPAAVCIAAG